MKQSKTGSDCIGACLVQMVEARVPYYMQAKDQKWYRVRDLPRSKSILIEAKQSKEDQDQMLSKRRSMTMASLGLVRILHNP